MVPRTSDNCVIVFWSLLLLTSINLICFTQSLAPLTNETDRLALLAFKAQISVDPNRVLSSWNDSLHFCMWDGVTCGRRHSQRVTALNFINQSLVGYLSPHIGNLTFLRYINLSSNSFQGQIPQEVGRLSRLRILALDSNTFNGEIPKNLTHCLKLRAIDFYGNMLVGKIPLDIGSLSKLDYLGLRMNKLMGHIPSSLGNLSSLDYLDLQENILDGSIPRELGQLVNLRDLDMGGNKLYGNIPFSLYNLSLIRMLDVTVNRLDGSLPAELGLLLPNLEGLFMAGNRFTGLIPVSLGNASRLTILDFSDNDFNGSMPLNLGGLKGLKHLNVEINQLVNGNDEEFTFITSLNNCSDLQMLALDRNLFRGTLPGSIAYLSAKLIGLWFGGNQFFGAIPTGIGNLTNLMSLGLEVNLFTEYGTGANTSTSGDVYSYGIVLLEMLTGKRPSDDMFENNLSLHQFAKMVLPERVMEIIDHRLVSEEIEVAGHRENSSIKSILQESLISLVKIGVSCSHELPKERMEMKDVVIEIQKVRDFYLRC